MKTILHKTSLVVFLILAAFTTAHAFTATTSGNWSSAATWGGTGPGGTVSNASITIPTGITVTLDMDVSFSGLANSFTINGSLTSASLNAVTISQGSFTGSGTVSINKLVFTLGTYSFTGNLTVHQFVNSGATLLIGSVVNVIDTLNMDSGSLLLNTGANLTVQTNSTVRVNGGSMTINGGLFSSGNNYNVLYVGSSKTSGIELNSSTIQNVYVRLSSNSQILTAGSNLTVNSNLYFTTGQIDITGIQLTLKGDLNAGVGALFTSSSTSNIVIQAPASLTSGLSFNSGSAVNDLTINMAGNGMVKLASGLAIAGHLKLMNGSFRIDNSGTLTLNAGSIVHVESGSLMLNGGTFSGTASYSVEYMGGSQMAGLELTGSGLTNLTIDLTSASAIITLNGNTTLSGAMSMTMGELMLSGHMLVLNGTLSSSAQASFSGDAAAEIDLNLSSSNNDTLWFSATGQSLSKLKLNLGAAGTVTLGTGLSIASELNLANGKLELINNDLAVQSTATITAFSNANYVVTSGSGRLQLYVNASSPYVTFPIGTSTTYSPGYIQQTSGGSSGNFMMHVMSGVYTNGTTGFNSATVTSVVNRTWLIDAAAGVTVNMNMRLGWETSDEVNGFNRAMAHISHYYSNSWDTYADAAASAGANSTFELSRTGVMSLSPFSVVDNQAVMGIASHTIQGFKLYPDPVSDVITIDLVQAGDPYLYEIVDITGKTLLSTSNSNSLNSFSVSDLSDGCYFIRVTNLMNNTVGVKRFIKN
jgi:hypothetical protein